ncbi:MAG: enoyl-CoA hydratase/isomerase family protein [Myxococcota bacterium]
MNIPPFKVLNYEVSGHVCTLTMNRPEKRNALTAQLVNELIVGLETADADSNIRVIVLTGAGGAFCAGADLSLMSGSGGEDPDIPHRGGFPELNMTMRNIGTPIIARVERYAMAGGLALICGSTFVVAEDNATFSAPEIDRGIFPMMVLASLFRTVSKRDGLNLVLTGRKFDAQSAVQMGLISQAVPSDQLDAAVNELAQTLANKPPAAIRLGLSAYHAQAEMDFEAALPFLQTQLFACLETEDAQEGIMAFLQKRTPEWKGR